MKLRGPDRGRGGELERQEEPGQRGGDGERKKRKGELLLDSAGGDGGIGHDYGTKT